MMKPVWIVDDDRSIRWVIEKALSREGIAYNSFSSAQEALDALSGGRFRLGLGVSGPQVAEGWHGQPFGRPLRRTREYVEIVRAILGREKPLEYHGECYRIPYAGPDATGLGKPLRSILHGRAELPIYLAAIGPKNVALAAEIGDGWIPVFFSPARMKMFREWLDEGFRKTGPKPGFDVMPLVAVKVGDDVAARRTAVKSRVALYVGGMGARGKNFYNDHAKRLGFEEAAVKIQDLYLAGKRAEAIAAVPDEMIDAVALVGPKARIKDRLQAWKEAGKKGHVHTMQIGTGQPEALKLLAEELL